MREFPVNLPLHTCACIRILDQTVAIPLTFCFNKQQLDTASIPSYARKPDSPLICLHQDVNVFAAEITLEKIASSAGPAAATTSQPAQPADSSFLRFPMRAKRLAYIVCAEGACTVTSSAGGKPLQLTARDSLQVRCGANGWLTFTVDEQDAGQGAQLLVIEMGEAKEDE